MTLRGNAELVGRTPVGRVPRKRSREICVQVCLNTTQLSLRVSPQQARLEAAARVISYIYLCGQEVSLEGSSLSTPEAKSHKGHSPRKSHCRHPAKLETGISNGADASNPQFFMDNKTKWRIQYRSQMLVSQTLYTPTAISFQNPLGWTETKEQPSLPGTKCQDWCTCGLSPNPNPPGSPHYRLPPGGS